MGIDVAIIGGRGHTGSELLPLIHRHPECRIAAVASSTAAGQEVGDHVDALEGSGIVFQDIRPETLERFPADVLILALPNGEAAAWVDAIDRCRPDTVVIDLSADYRFDDTWVYGLPERFRDRIRGARRIANPGCYATGGQLALAPIADRVTGTPVVFGVSGYSGAGKTPSRKNDAAVLADNLLPYALADHVHEREMSRHLGRAVRFLPHVAPFFRGISLTVAAELDEPVTAEALLAEYEAFYRDAPLVPVSGPAPEVTQVRGTATAMVGGFTVGGDGRRVAIVSVIDNLLKGAASQAVQNLNLAFGLDELAGLELCRTPSARVHDG